MVSSFYSAIIVKFVIDILILFYSLRNFIAVLYFIFVVFLPLFAEKLTIKDKVIRCGGDAEGSPMGGLRGPSRPQESRRN